MAKREMTPEQKAAAAERLRKAREAKAAAKAEEEQAVADSTGIKEPETEAKAQQSDEVAELRELVRRLQEQLSQKDPQIVQVMADGEKIVMRFQSECADDNLATFGPNGTYGQVTGKVGRVVVPKAEWSRFYTSEVRYLLDTRQLIVLSGMSEDERDAYNVNYKAGELLDEAAFRKLVDLGDELIAIFPKLCVPHKEMVAKRFQEAYVQGNRNARNRELVTALNEISKQDYTTLPAKDPRRRGAFWPVIEMMNNAEAQV